MNILVLLAGAKKGQTLEPCGCGLVDVLCQTSSLLGEEKGECTAEVGNFILFLSWGPTLQTLSLFHHCLSLPTPPEDAIPSREPSLLVGTDLKGSELSPAKPTRTLWTIAKPNGMSGPGVQVVVQCRQSGFWGDLAITAFSFLWEAM